MKIQLLNDGNMNVLAQSTWEWRKEISMRGTTYHL